MKLFADIATRKFDPIKRSSRRKKFTKSEDGKFRPQKIVFSKLYHKFAVNIDKTRDQKITTFKKTFNKYHFLLFLPPKICFWLGHFSSDPYKTLEDVLVTFADSQP